MPTGADLRRAVLSLVDELDSYVPRTFTATGGTTTTITSTDLAALPDDTTLLKGGYVRLADGSVRYVSDFDISGGIGTVTFTPSATSPSNGDVIEFSRDFTPGQIDTAVSNVAREIQRKVWVPTSQVLTVRQQYVHLYRLPAAWSGVNSVQCGGSRYGYGNDLNDFLSLSSNRTATWTPSATGWVRYLAIFLKGTATSSVTVTLGSLGSGVVLAADVPSVPQWMIADLGSPVKVTSGVSQLITVSANSTVSVGVDTNNAACFQIYQDQGDWYDLSPELWSLESDRMLRLKDSQAAYSAYNPDRGYVAVDSLVKITGIRYPAEPSNAANLEMPWDYLLYGTAFNLMAPKFRVQSPDQEDDRARIWAGKVAQAEAGFVSWPGNTRKILAVT